MSVDMEGGNPNMDYQMHQNNYRLFVTLFKYGTAAVVIILFLMWYFLV